MDLKKEFDKVLKDVPAASEDCLEVYENPYTYIFPILQQNKQKPITNSCRNNLWSKPILTLSKTDFRILIKKPCDEAFRVSFKFPRRG